MFGRCRRSSGVRSTSRRPSICSTGRRHRGRKRSQRRSSSTRRPRRASPASLMTSYRSWRSRCSVIGRRDSTRLSNSCMTSSWTTSNIRETNSDLWYDYMRSNHWSINITGWRLAYAQPLADLLRPSSHYFDHRSHAQCNSSISSYSACVLRHVCFENNHYPKPQP